MPNAIPTKSALVHIVRLLLSRILHHVGLLRKVLLLDGCCVKSINGVAWNLVDEASILVSKRVYGILYGGQGVYRFSRAIERLV